MKRSLQYILAICLVPLLATESSLAASFDSGSTVAKYHRLAPKLVIDLNNISAHNLFSTKHLNGSLIDKSGKNNDTPFNFSEAPQFTVDLTNIELFRFKKSNQLIRYILTDSGEQSLSIVEQSGTIYATSLIVHDNFVGIGRNEKGRHFVIGKESNNGETILRARWGYRF